MDLTGSARGGRGSKAVVCRGGARSKIEKKINPTNEKDKTLVFASCGSFRHLLADSPDSYENLLTNRVFKQQRRMRVWRRRRYYSGPTSNQA